MAETVLIYQTPVVGPDGIEHEARACGGPDDTGMWQGWIEFVPFDGGLPLRSPRETTQPNRADLIYWATGLTPVYLEGALRRALEPPHASPVDESLPAIFDEPAPPPAASRGAEVTSVLDPFSVYEKGEALLRRQLAAFSKWHLVNIALDYDLTDADEATLNSMTEAGLIELIVLGVRSTAEARRAH
jgi:hypothetical protein